MADRLNEGGFFLPNNQSLDTPAIEHVCEVVKGAVLAFRQAQPAKSTKRSR
jgi:hypothetical protein